MVIHVQSHADMKTYTAHLGPEGELEVPPQTTVGDVLAMLRVPGDRKTVVLVNGRARQPDHELQPGDRVVFFPPLEGG